MKCKVCGAPIDNDVEVCPYCGSAVEENQKKSSIDQDNGQKETAERSVGVASGTKKVFQSVPAVNGKVYRFQSAYIRQTITTIEFGTDRILISAIPKKHAPVPVVFYQDITAVLISVNLGAETWIEIVATLLAALSNPLYLLLTCVALWVGIRRKVVITQRNGKDVVFYTMSKKDAYSFRDDIASVSDISYDASDKKIVAAGGAGKKMAVAALGVVAFIGIAAAIIANGNRKTSRTQTSSAQTYQTYAASEAEQQQSADISDDFSGYWETYYSGTGSHAGIDIGVYGDAYNLTAWTYFDRQSAKELMTGMLIDGQLVYSDGMLVQYMYGENGTEASITQYTNGNGYFEICPADEIEQYFEANFSNYNVAIFAREWEGTSYDDAHSKNDEPYLIWIETIPTYYASQEYVIWYSSQLELSEADVAYLDDDWKRVFTVQSYDSNGLLVSFLLCISFMIMSTSSSV
jgi:hypothetical protein